ncbi:hypothetical protein FALCPG4_002839 [Fusarium falciforme]|nr:hypothetical protein NW757_000839 [Fusarium falciforme]
MAHMGGTRRKKQKANADAANGWMLVVEGGTQRKRRTEKRLQPTPTGGVDNRREQQAREGKSRTRKDWTDEQRLGLSRQSQLQLQLRRNRREDQKERMTTQIGT